MQELQLLNDRLDTLLKKYATLQAENRSLKETIAQQRQSMESLNGKLATIEENMAASHIGKAVADDKEKQALRKQLDSVITEIDKILTTLDD